MDIEKERELFLYELDGHGYEFYNKTWIHGLGDVGNRFDDDQLNMLWEIWLASRNREGYVLVPVESLKEIIDCAYCHIYDRCVGNEGDYVIKHIKAMGIEDDD